MTSTGLHHVLLLAFHRQLEEPELLEEKNKCLQTQKRALQSASMASFLSSWGKPAGFEKNPLISATSLQSLLDLRNDFVGDVFNVIEIKRTSGGTVCCFGLPGSVLKLY